MVKFYNDKGKLLLTYSTYEGMEEVNATIELLEYENNCRVKVIFD